MLVTTLPYPGIVAGGIKLRRRAAKSINIVEDAVRANKGKPTAPTATLATFFLACAAAAAKLASPKA